MDMDIILGNMEIIPCTDMLVLVLVPVLELGAGTLRRARLPDSANPWDGTYT